MLQEMLHRMRRPVQILGISDPNDSDRTFVDLLEMLRDLGNSYLVVRLMMASEPDAWGAALNIQALPMMGFLGPQGELAPIDLIGVPRGYQFGALLTLILALGSSYHLPLGHGVIGALRNLSCDVLLEVFVSPTCPHSPHVARLAEQFALANPARVHTRIIDAIAFPQLAPRGLETVPHIRVQALGQVIGTYTGMTTASKLWQLVNYGLKGANR